MCLVVGLAVIYWDSWDRWRERFKLVVRVEREVMEKGDVGETVIVMMEMGDIRGGMMMMADTGGGDDGSWNDSMTI